MIKINSALRFFETKFKLYSYMYNKTFYMWIIVDYYFFNIFNLYIKFNIKIYKYV